MGQANRALRRGSPTPQSGPTRTHMLRYHQTRDRIVSFPNSHAADPRPRSSPHTGLVPFSRAGQGLSDASTTYPAGIGCNKSCDAPENPADGAPVPTTIVVARGTLKDIREIYISRFVLTTDYLGRSDVPWQQYHNQMPRIMAISGERRCHAPSRPSRRHEERG